MAVSVFFIVSIYLLVADYRLDPTTLNIFAFSLLTILDVFGYATVLLLCITFVLGYKLFKNKTLNPLSVFISLLTIVCTSSGIFDMHFTGHLLQMTSGGGLLGDAIVALGSYMIDLSNLTLILVVLLLISLVIALRMPIFKLSEDTGFLLLHFNKNTLLEFSLRYFPIFFKKNSLEAYSHKLHTQYTKETDSILYDQSNKKPPKQTTQQDLFAYAQAPVQLDITKNDPITQVDLTKNDATQADITQDDIAKNDPITQVDLTKNDATQADITQDDIAKNDATQAETGKKKA